MAAIKIGKKMEAYIYATAAMTITHGCGHVEYKSIGDPIYDRCFICWPPK